MGMVGITKRGLIMNKILFLLLGFSINLIAMDPPKVEAAKQEADKQKAKVELVEAKKDDDKQKGRELIRRNVPSSGSVAPSSSMPKVTSTSTMTSDGKSSPDSSSLETEMAQIDLDKDGHAAAIAKQQKRRSLLPVELEYLDDVLAAERVLQLMEEREKQKKKQEEAAATRLATNDKKEKRKSVEIYVKAKKHIIPQLPLGDIEQANNESDITDAELERILTFISLATADSIVDIRDRLKAKLKELHNTPPASPLFAEQASALDALNTVRKLTNNHISTTRVAESLKRQAQPVHAVAPVDVIAHEGFEKGFGELLKLVNSELATKLAQTGKSRSIYRGLTYVVGAATAGLTIYEAYNKATGGNDSNSVTPTCPPTTTFPM